MKRTMVYLSVIAAVAIALVLVLSPLSAQVGPQAAPADYEIIVDGLANPRGIHFAPDGSLWITEAGTGGPEDGLCAEGGTGKVCYGPTGAVTQVTFDDQMAVLSATVVVSGLASVAPPDTMAEASGPSDIYVVGPDEIYVLMGLGMDPANRADLEPGGASLGHLIGINSMGEKKSLVDIAQYEADEDPDGEGPDSNPFSLIVEGDDFVVTDAGGNDLLRVPQGDDISLMAVFDSRLVEFPPESGMMIPMDAVPTAVEVGPDGAFYVSQLTGFPFPPGGAYIFRVEEGEDPEVYAGGFTNILDLAFDDDGTLYVLEMTQNGLLSGDPTGAITQIAPYGARSTIASDGLILPVDMEIGPDGALYVVVNGPSPTDGAVVRVPLPTTTTMIGAYKDNTLYESAQGTISNGVGEHFFAGMTNNSAIRRGLLSFNIPGAIPYGSDVVSVTLDLNMSKTAAGETKVSLHTLLKDFGEGDSDADADEGAGATAQPGDATWIDNFLGTSAWDESGGDFVEEASASTEVGATGPYSWSSDQMAADVQDASDADQALGWLVHGDEGSDKTAKRFDTRENTVAENRPKLTIEFVAPLAPYTSFVPLVNTAD